MLQTKIFSDKYLTDLVILCKIYSRIFIKRHSKSDQCQFKENNIGLKCVSVLLHNDEILQKFGKSLTNASFSAIISVYILYVLETFSPHNFDYVVMPLLHNFDYVVFSFYSRKSPNFCICRRCVSPVSIVYIRVVFTLECPSISARRTISF